MRPTSILDRIISFILRPFKPKTMRVMVVVGDKLESVEVPNPINFSELNDRFGEGNWKL